MSRKKVPFLKRIDDGILNVFAIIVTTLPIFSLGYFVQAQFFSDPRRVSELSVISQVAEPRLFEEGIVSITFDDGWESVYTTAAPLLQKYSMRSTQYILPGEFDSYNYISTNQTESLKKAGHEIYSHTMTHPRLNSISRETALQEMEQSKKILIEKKLVGDKVHFAAPESETNDYVDSQIYRLYASHRNTFGDLSNGIDEKDVNLKSDMFDRYNIIGYSVRPETKVEDIKQALAYAKQNNGWLVLVYHQIDDSKTSYSSSALEFENHLKAIKQSGVKVAPLGQVLDRSKEY